MNINDIFTIEQYDEAYEFVSSHEYTSIEDLGNGQYKIIQLHIPTEEEIEQQEKERIAHLHLTKREVFLGLHKAQGITPDVIEQGIKDPEALIEFQYATEYFRGNPLVDMIGQSLGIKSEQLDKFFETNDYTYLLDPVEPTEPSTEEPTVEPTI